MIAEGIFGQSERTFDLRQAILLYAERSGNVSAATVHEVEVREGKPTLKEGRPVTLAGVEKLAESLGRKIENCLLPEHILSISMSQMVWWCPAGRRRIWFRPEGKDDEIKTGLKALNGKYVMHPPLIFSAGGYSLRVNALAENKRPLATSKVYVAPYYNVGLNGSMCKGNAVLPKIISPGLTDQYEAGFFNSAFSHSNYGHKLTRHKGNHLGLWQEMQTAKVFPRNYLQPYKSGHTVSSFLKGDRHED